MNLNIKLFIFVCIGCLFFLELGSFAVLYNRNGDTSYLAGFENKTVQNKTEIYDQNNENWKKRNWNEDEILHPYFGFVRETNDRFIKNQGFDSYFHPIQEKSSHKFIVGLFGGSVADELKHALYKSLNLKLKSNNTKKELVLINFAHGGYKQPQQLLELTYYLALGAQFDVVINVDGFNELALSWIDNIKNGIYPYFPRDWGSRVKNNYSASELKKLGLVLLVQDKIDKWSAFCLNTHIYLSPTVNLLAGKILEKWENEKRLILKEIQSAKRIDFQGKGPFQEWKFKNDIHKSIDAVGRVWEKSSLEMFDLSKNNDFTYYHFLQPNQYVADSKPFSKTELESRILSEDIQSYGTPARIGYPKLCKLGLNIQEAGVNYYDLTRLFKDTTETVYKDNCCHFTEDGYAKIADYITDEILSRD